MKKVALIVVAVAAVAAIVIPTIASNVNRSTPTQSAEPAKPARQVTVAFTSDPTGASVFLDGRKVGTTPVALEVDAGRTYDYRLFVKEPPGDVRLYKKFVSRFTTDENTAISIWIDRTTAEEQAVQRQEAEDKRQAEAEALQAQEQSRMEEQERAAQEQQRLIEAERLYYRIETNCRNGVDLTYSNAYGDTTQQGNQGNGWYYSFVPRNGQFLYLSAQNQCDSGYVRVKFVKDGVVVRENTSTGAYVIASLSASW